MWSGDYGTDYHVHTARCGHAGGTMREYVETALARGLSDHTIDFLALRASPDVSSTTPAVRREVFFDRTWTGTPIVSRGNIIGPLQGPLIIESADTTIVVPPGASIAPNRAGGLMAILDSAGS